MKIRFLADANFKQPIVLGIRRHEPRIDFLWGGVADLTGLPDLDVLSLGASDGRVVVAHDIRTFPLAFAEFIATTASAGVILVPQNLPISLAIRSLIRVWEEYSADEWRNRMVRVPL